ncbi:unnamed protein product, partial [Ilex paraguariensis]
SKVPARVFGAKGPISTNMLQPPAFDPLVDMDPRLVVALFDMPRDADISALVLRFGGECELVWLNDKNALAVFSDPARAATAMRRLDQGSVYYGAAVLQNGGASAATSASNAWGVAGVAKDGGALASLKANPWKKAVVPELDWTESSWGAEEGSGDPAEVEVASIWKVKEAPIAASANRWTVLDSEITSSSSSTAPVQSKDPGEPTPIHNNKSGLEPTLKASSSNVVGQPEGEVDEMSDVVDDWEKACD